MEMNKIYMDLKIIWKTIITAFFTDGMDESSELSTPVTAEARGEGDPLLLSPTSQAPSGIPAEGEKKERKKRTTIGLGL